MSNSATPAARIEAALARLDEREGELHAMMPEPGRRERLEREAALLEARPESERGPLFGVLVAVKDVFHVDGLPTTGGSRLPPEELAGPEAVSVTRLRRAGALVLGKAVSTEFAFYAPGPTRNPRNPAHTPGGSSSGSAAAVAAGYCPLALGTQTIGSITRPASFCGVVGYKPSYGRISTEGLIPLAPTFDHVGVLASSVEWARRAAAVLCEDWRVGDPQGSTSLRRRPVLAVPEGPYLARAGEAMLRHFESVLTRLTTAGWEVRRISVFDGELDAIDPIEASHFDILAAEVAERHQGWVSRHRALYHPTTLELIEEGRKMSSARLTEAHKSPPAVRRELERRRTEGGFELWISPSAPGPAPRGIESTGDPVMNRPWTHAGLPTLGLPSGNDPETGLPLGIQLAAGFGQDEKLLTWGAELAAVVDPKKERSEMVGRPQEGMI